MSAHFVSRTLRALSHEPRIIPAIYVKPFVKGQKNDYNDAEAVTKTVPVFLFALVGSPGQEMLA